MKKLYVYTGEQFLLKEGTLEEIRENYNKKPIYLTYDRKTTTDTTPRVWYITYELNEENQSRTLKYCSGLGGEPDFPLYEKIAYSLGYLYDDERLKWIQKITNYKKVNPEDVF